MADIPYRLDKKLIVIKAVFQGKQGRYDADLILDTGASLTILDPFVIGELGYSDKDQSAPSTVQSPDIDGLLGMNFLEQYDFCIYPRKRVIRMGEHWECAIK